MADLSFYVGVIGNVISVLVFLSPVETFWKIVQRRSTEEYECLPYICTLMSSSLWTYYGIVTPGEYLVSTVNGFGALAESIYVLIFLFFVPKPRFLKTIVVVLALNVCFPVLAIVGTRTAFEDENRRSSSMGFICATLNIVMYGSPLSAIKTVVTTRSVQFMPFWLSFFLFLNGAIWGVYAFLLHDVFLLVPNGMGFLLGTMQLLIYAYYRNVQPNVEDEEGLIPNQPLLA
ncbi:SWEET sugar transporter [Arabidopsis suecica]|uniref:Bidirectional sugar transporter SWEET n=1 Tax=Arabidopsis suecica TaxID=45249 RepID=A0A8T2BAM7_ARASU|nr:SWEET sugar transporter [Arabidopsis suecica]